MPPEVLHVIFSGLKVNDCPTMKIYGHKIKIILSKLWDHKFSVIFQALSSRLNSKIFQHKRRNYFSTFQAKLGAPHIPPKMAHRDSKMYETTSFHPPNEISTVSRRFLKYKNVNC